MRKHRDCPVTDGILCFLRVRIGVGGRHLGLTRPRTNCYNRKRQKQRIAGENI